MSPDKGRLEIALYWDLLVKTYIAQHGHAEIEKALSSNRTPSYLYGPVKQTGRLVYLFAGDCAKNTCKTNTESEKIVNTEFKMTKKSLQ